MSRKKFFEKIMGHPRWISGIGFIVAIIIGFIIRPIFGDLILPGVPPTMQGALLFLIVLIVSEKFSSLVYQQTLDDKIKDLDQNSRKVIETLGINLMPIDIQGIWDGVEASKMLDNLLKDATSVRNTYFISLEKEDRSDLTDYNFKAGIAIIEKVWEAVEQGKEWKDIVSLSGMERILILALLFKKRNIDGSTYTAYKMDHDKPMVNFIIIKYAHRESIVLFGWGLHKAQRMAPVFLSRNKEIVTYFEKYFESLTLEKTNQKIKMKDYMKQDSESLMIELRKLMPSDLIQPIQDTFLDS